MIKFHHYLNQPTGAITRTYGKIGFGSRWNLRTALVLKHGKADSNDAFGDRLSFFGYHGESNNIQLIIRPYIYYIYFDYSVRH